MIVRLASLTFSMLTTFILVHTETELQSTLDLFLGAYHSLGLSLNIGKTKLLHQPALAQVAPLPPK